MSLTLDDLVASMMRNATYIEQATQELIPDDTMDLLKGTRKGKSDVKQMSHILGVSEVQVRKKAREQRLIAVTQGQQAKLVGHINALGIYLRKFVIENVAARDDVTLDTKFLGKFTLMRDTTPDYGSLYPKKIIYEPSGLLA